MEQQSQPSKDKIKKEMLIADVVMEFPEVAPILMGYGLHCVNCHVSAIETLEQGAKTHGLPDDVVDMMLRDANAVIDKGIKE